MTSLSNNEENDNQKNLTPDESDLPVNVYTIAKIIYEARKKTAWGKKWEIDTPCRERYGHNPHADFDLCIAAAKALIKNGLIK